MLTRRDFLRITAALAAGASSVMLNGVPLQVLAQDPLTGEVTVFWRVNPNEIKTMQAAFDKFSEQNSGVKVNFIQAPGNIEGDAKLQSLYAAGTPPEVFASVFASGLVDYIYKDFVADLTPLIERDKVDQSDFNEAAINTLTFGGKQYGLPRGGTVIALFYNKDLFDQAKLPYPPADWEDPTWTWEKMLEYAKALTLDTDNDGRTDQYGVLFDNTNYTVFSALPLMWGKTILPPDAAKYGLTRTHNFSDPTVIEAFQRVADLNLVEEVAPPANLGADTGGPFLTGKLGMLIGLANFPAISQAKFNWGIAALPRGAADIQQGTLTFTGPMLLADGSPNQATGWELVKYLTSSEGQQFLLQGAVVGTSRKSLYSEWLSRFSKEPDSLSAVIQGGYKHGIESPNVRTVQWGQILTAIRGEFDKVFLGEATAQQAADALAPKLDALLARIYEENAEKAKSIFPDFT